MSDLTKKQTRQMDRWILKIIGLFIKFRGRQTLLRVDKAVMENGKKKFFRVEIMEVF